MRSTIKARIDQIDRLSVKNVRLVRYQSLLETLVLEHEEVLFLRAAINDLVAGGAVNPAPKSQGHIRWFFGFEFIRGAEGETKMAPAGSEIDPETGRRPSIRISREQVKNWISLIEKAYGKKVL